MTDSSHSSARALLLEQIHPDAETLLRDAGLIVETADRAYDEDELAGALTEVTVLGIRSKTRITRRVLDAAPNLVAIGAFCIGTNQIDLEAASERGVTVFNAPFSNTRSVVELAVSEIIALTRRLTEKNELMHDGVWDKSADGAHEVRGRSLGIVGYGNIGSQLSVLAENLGMRVVFYDPADKLALGNARRCGSLHELLGTADVVTLHVDGRRSNARLLRAGRVRRNATGQPVHELVTRLRRRLRSAAPGHRGRSTSPVPPSTSSPASPRVVARSSSPNCGGCPT